MTQPSCYIYLIPGFFGFSSLGAYSYFFRVGDTLASYLKTHHDLDVQIVRCTTQATSSIKRRAKVIIDEVVQSGGLNASDIHFVGHSSGGLDMRLLLSPGVHLRDDGVESRIADKTRSAISVSSPHFGTPLAGFFTTMQGRHILQLITSLANHGAGRRSIFLLSKALSVAAKLDDWIGREQTFLDHLVNRLLSNVTLDADNPIWTFLETMKNDQGAIIQLTPEGMHLFNAAVTDHDGIDYGCVATSVKKPMLQTYINESTSATAAASLMLFSFLYTVTSREHPHYPYPSPSEETLTRLISQHVPATPQTNDGIAPLLSQLHGKLIDVQQADHLDIVGQFNNAGGELFTDWMVSGAPFTETQFQRCWARIGDQIAHSQKER